MNQDQAALQIAPSPHVFAPGVATTRMMVDVVLALAPVVAMAIYVFQWFAVLQLSLSVLSCLGAEAIFTRMRGRGSSLGDFSAAVTGVGDLLCNFARCCRPVPPEPIVGYITQGRGVSIHRQDCGNFLNLLKNHPERVIEVDWGASPDAIYPVELNIHAFDRQGLLKDISTIMADEQVSVEGVQTNTDKRTMKAEMQLQIAVPGLPTLSRVIDRLEQLPNVTSVRRKT